MPYRIIYCALSCVTFLAKERHDRLGSLDQGMIAAVPDDVMHSLLETQPQTPVLFFSRSEYDRAVRGLSSADVDAAMRRRLAQWAPRALESSLEWLATGERRALTLTARTLPTADGQRARLLETHFARGLDLLASIAGTDRYDQMPLAELLTAIVEAEALLLAELPQSSEATTRREWATALAGELKRHGQAAFAQALPFAAPERGVWIAPADEAVRAYLKTRGLVGIEWRRGVVTTLSLRAIEQFQQQGKQAAILYPDPGTLLHDASELSPTQLLQRFETLQSSTAAAREHQQQDYLNILRLNVALQRLALRARAGVEDRSMAGLLDDECQHEARILREALARTGSWLVPGDETGPLERLELAEDEELADARFLSDLARQRGDAYLVRRLESILERKLEDQKRVAAVRSAVGG